MRLSSTRHIRPFQAAAHLIFSAVFAVTAGCGSESDPYEAATTEPAPAAPPEASSLRLFFPEQAARVLDSGSRFRAVENGFVSVAPQQADRDGVDLKLPREGTGAIRLRLASGFEISVREIGAFGEGTIVDRAVAYAREGGTSYWSVTDGAPEEWLYLDAEAVRAGEPVAAWEIDGGVPRKIADLVEIDDEAGIPRLRMAAPAAYAAGGREIATRFEVRGSRVELSVDAQGEAVLVDPVWTATTAMSKARQGHTGTRLPNGKILIVGGAPDRSAEVYDPATQTWAATGTMAAQHVWHTATLLPSGKVLVTGGVYDAGAELYTPATNSWTAAGAMVATRANHTASLLPNGNVLLAGGRYAVATAEVYDAVTNTFAAVGSMKAGRAFHKAVTLAGGKVLVMGGLGAEETSLASAELFDPATNQWATTGALGKPRSDHTATLLPSGKVLVAGGNDWYTPTAAKALSAAELFDPASGTWSPASSMAQFRFSHTATLLGNGNVMVAGNLGGGSHSVETYDPAANTWLPTSPLTQGRWWHTATLLADNQRVLVAGGNVGAHAELLTPIAKGEACTGAGDCATGFCVDGVCCDTACNAGICDACSVAAGATTNGTCALLTGRVCNDGNACTQTDTCQAGVCVGSNPVVCTAIDQCHNAGTCNRGTGACSTPAKPNGTACNDGNACTQTDTCQAGACVGSNPVSCSGHGSCNAGSGICGCATGYAGAACDACAPGYYGYPSCMPQGAVGVACTANVECAGGLCVDGFCCDAACAGQCEACDVPGLEGSCSPVTGAPHGDRTACASDGSECGGACDGAARSACVFPGADVRCAEGACTNHGAVASSCDGQGACVADAPVDCGAYGCDADGCKASCASGDDCAQGYVCERTRCVEDAGDAGDGGGDAGDGGGDAGDGGDDAGDGGGPVGPGDGGDAGGSGGVGDAGGPVGPGDGGDAGDSEGPEGDALGADGGCSCRGARGSSSVPSVGWLGLAVAAAALRRRRAA